ncbi:RNA methyltransferase, TrmH family [Fistulifera solaris]|uniref:RNA methyltransferase, TrmH family n=1 Tax=Fistulifera solaris TaxID=1519565 RepID=A0A1Z5JQU5_FISSO|nr:RNA methyltransferase, TrmH family [Fistulifera solaris]|eukprot:GAX16329.1 RNA methyltransferase, TrmH family [Fistulifera solaris]
MAPFIPLCWIAFSFVRQPVCRKGHRSAPRCFSSSSRLLLTVKNVITSPKSNTLQKVQKLLQQRKKRLEYNQVVVEGPRSVLDLLKTHSQVVRQVIVDVDQLHYHAALSQYETELEICYATAAALQSCSDTNQGIFAVCDIPQPDSVVPSSELQRVTLILDALQDPGNVGTLIRSAAATGVVEHIYFLPGTCDPWNPKALRAAMATTFGVSMRFVDSWDGCLQELRQQQSHDHFPIYAAAMTNESECYHEIISKWAEEPDTHKMALILGSEGNGLSPEIQQALKTREIQGIHIPMQPVVESLNAAVCGSILLYEVLRCLESSKQR